MTQSPNGGHFVERRETAVTEIERGLFSPTRWTVDAGICRDGAGRDGLSARWWVPESGAQAQVPAELREAAEQVLDAPMAECGSAEEYAELAHALEAAGKAAGAVQVDVLLQQVNQRVAVGGPGPVATDWRRVLLVELRTFVEDAHGKRDLWRAASQWPNAGELSSHREEVFRTLREMVDQLRDAGRTVECPRGEFPVVFPAGGASGAFFHEVCGHPLEADVVSCGGSYLARRLGEQVAEEFVEVRDDPTGAPSAVSYAMDDEGHPAQSVALISRGRVNVPVASREAARRLGIHPNGHGRRVSFRHTALSRMSHTTVGAGPLSNAEVLRGVGEGLLASHVRPRHMNLLSGDFSFYIVEGQLIRDGKPGPFVGPGIIRGNGLEALRRIEAVGSEVQNLFSTRGCRKLDHGPLSVSFGQPALRFSRLLMEPCSTRVL